MSLNDEKDDRQHDTSSLLNDLVKILANCLSKYKKHFKCIITCSNNKKSRLLHLLKVSKNF